MESLSTDTSPEAEAVLLELLRRAPVWKHLQMVDQIHETLRLLTTADLRRCYPTADENEIRRRLAARVHSRADVMGAYDWDPEIEGY